MMQVGVADVTATKLSEESQPCDRRLTVFQNNPSQQIFRLEISNWYDDAFDDPDCDDECSSFMTLLYSIVFFSQACEC